MQKIEVIVTNLEDTLSLAKFLANELDPPTVFALNGTLGAGKTTFVSGFVSTLKTEQKVCVQSPTYAIARSYATSPPVHHIDLYRFADSPKSELLLEDLGIAELLYDNNAFIFVEWPLSYLKHMNLNQISIEIVSTESDRMFTFTFSTDSFPNLKSRIINAGFRIQIQTA